MGKCSPNVEKYMQNQGKTTPNLLSNSNTFDGHNAGRFMRFPASSSGRTVKLFVVQKAINCLSSVWMYGHNVQQYFYGEMMRSWLFFRYMSTNKIIVWQFIWTFGAINKLFWTLNESHQIVLSLHNALKTARFSNNHTVSPCGRCLRNEECRVTQLAQGAFGLEV